MPVYCAPRAKIWGTRTSNISVCVRKILSNNISCTVLNHGLNILCFGEKVDNLIELKYLLGRRRRKIGTRKTSKSLLSRNIPVDGKEGKVSMPYTCCIALVWFDHLLPICLYIRSYPKIFETD